MSGAPRRAAPLRWTAGRARAGIAAIGRGDALDGMPQRRRFVEGLQPAGDGWFTQMANLPIEAIRPVSGDLAGPELDRSKRYVLAIEQIHRARKRH